MLPSMRMLPTAVLTLLLTACSSAPKSGDLCACGPDCACAPCNCPKTPTQARAKAEAIQLFNGRNLEGWRAVYQSGPGDMNTAWSVKDGILRCEGQPIGYMQTTASYESFKLVVEWRFDPAKGAGNSGVLLRVTGPDHVWPRSIEAQLHSRNAGDIWNIGSFPMQAVAERTGGRHTGKAHDTNEKPLGEWNRYEITLDGGALSLVVNGLEQNVATDCEVIPGGIGLQSEGSYIEFRKVELTPL
jgi:hypothetical protein